MGKVSRKGKGKVLLIQLNVFPCGRADPTKNLTISCPDKNTQFKTTLSDYGLAKFKDSILRFYKQLVLERKEE